MKRFTKPYCEVVHFTNNVIATSACGCDVGGFDFGTNNCTNDTPAQCTCQVNYVAGTANCIPCSAYNG